MDSSAEQLYMRRVKIDPYIRLAFIGIVKSIMSCGAANFQDTILFCDKPLQMLFRIVIFQAVVAGLFFSAVFTSGAVFFKYFVLVACDYELTLYDRVPYYAPGSNTFAAILGTTGTPYAVLRFPLYGSFFLWYDNSEKIFFSMR